MNARLTAGARLATLVHWMAARGFTGVDLEAKGDLLIVKLAAGHSARLLSEPDLRGEVVSQGKTLGFSRVVLDLPVD